MRSDAPARLCLGFLWPHMSPLSHSAATRHAAHRLLGHSKAFGVHTSPWPAAHCTVTSVALHCKSSVKNIACLERRALSRP